ncbi:hypothetical protein Tco_0522372 [Tanacetum coccineum]
MNQNFNYSNSFGFDQIQPPQQFDNHQPQEIPEVIPFFDSETKNELYKMMEDFTKRMNQELRKQEVLLAAQREQELLAQKQAAQEKQVPSPNSVFRQLIEETCETPKVLTRAWEKFFEIQHAQPEDIQELLHKLLKDLQIISENAAEYINLRVGNRPAYYYEDDDEEYTIAITPDLPTEEPDNSLSMGDEHLSSIPEMESDEVIKSCVRTCPNPSASEIFRYRSECDVARIALDFEASRARGFVLRSFKLHILSFIMGIQYPNLID